MCKRVRSNFSQRSVESLCVVVLTGWAIVFCALANADESEKTYKLQTGSIDASSRHERREAGVGILEKLVVLDKLYPELTEKDKAWVENEAAALQSLSGSAFISKARQFHKSPLYQLQQLKKSLDLLIQSFECIKEKNVQLGREALCWAVAAFGLTDSDTFDKALKVLDRNSVVKLTENIYNQTYLTDFSKDDYWAWYRIMGRNAHRFILIPLLTEAANRGGE